LLIVGKKVGREEPRTIECPVKAPFPAALEELQMRRPLVARPMRKITRWALMGILPEDTSL